MPPSFKKREVERSPKWLKGVCSECSNKRGSYDSRTPAIAWGSKIDFGQIFGLKWHFGSAKWSRLIVYPIWTEFGIHTTWPQKLGCRLFFGKEFHEIWHENNQTWNRPIWYFSFQQLILMKRHSTKGLTPSRTWCLITPPLCNGTISTFILQNSHWWQLCTCHISFYMRSIF